ncbi:MAG: hypothetical protein J2P55_04440, partial [Rhizobiales bacterium]|nr:hypothetical protein [Hyphomicrobiales bacterium]
MASFLDTLFGGGAEAEAAQKDIAAAQQYQAGAQSALQQGYTTGTGAINQAIGAYQPLVNLGQTYSAAAPSYMAAIGAGTPDQQAAALAAFKNTPGYQATLDAASQAVARQRAVGGMGASGNADIDAMMAAAGITTPLFQQYVSNLGQAGQMGLQATGAGAQGTAAGYGSLANLATQYGEDTSGVLGNVESTTVGANNLQAAGEAAGAKNLLGAGLSLATLGLGGNPFGGSLSGGGGSSLLSGLKNLNLGQSLFGG